MKKKCSLFAFLCLMFHLQSQIGINTDNPQALFHLDGASSLATTNPSSGAVSVAQAVDDVLITESGNVGVGTLNPSTKLHIVSDGTTPALRIVDGKQAEGKVLTLDNSGAAGWFSLQSVVITQTPSTNGSYTNAASIMDGSHFTVVDPGDYLLFFSFWGTCTGLNGTNTTGLYIQVYKNYGLPTQKLLDRYEYYVTVKPYDASSTDNAINTALRPTDITQVSISSYFLAQEMGSGDTITFVAVAQTNVSWNYTYNPTYKSLMPNFVFIKIAK